MRARLAGASLCAAILAGLHPASAAAAQHCYTDPITREVVCVTTEDPKPGGGTPSKPGKPGPAPTCEYKGYPVPCVDDTGAKFDRGTGCYYKLANPQPPFTDPVWQGHTDGVVVAGRCLDPRDPDRRGFHFAWLPAAPGAASMEELARQAFSEIGFSTARIETQPKGNVTLVNLKTFYRVEWPDDTDARPDETIAFPPRRMLGHRFELKPVVVDYTYLYGDGQRSGATRSPGGIWPDGDITHTYTKRGTFTASVVVRVTAQYRVDGGAWQTIPDVVTLTPPGTPVAVKEMRAHLVS